ncbi:putative E3 ubiquitin-protein ligase SINA-like 9 [Aegilops tauschii subsp. strangulata]|uniref:SIAH-type domain-containing protein n=3 Tax=Aegilops tauschii subsp. strangulata TaxID=200361 RepID=A0A453DQI5_AEGTS|nr:putative E3 ubiquitin-protein ligase SINA-like 9 [Aegilops tauschii subsp. strangulata]
MGQSGCSNRLRKRQIILHLETASREESSTGTGSRSTARRARREIDRPSIMAKKAGADRTAAAVKAGSCSRKKAKAASSSKITVTLDPKLLECSVCCSPLVAPLSQCANGHITCFECSSDVNYSCSLCSGPANTHCSALERILAGLAVPCSFQEHGCTEMIPFTEKLAHEESCLHAPCHCPIAGCCPYPGRSLHDHIKAEHPMIQYTRITAGRLYPLSMRHDELACLVSLGSKAVFLLVVDRSVPSGLTLSVIHLMSDPIEREDFKYKIQVHTQTGILSLSGETQSVGRLRGPYQAGASLFVSDTMWSPPDSPVYLELKC